VAVSAMLAQIGVRAPVHSEPMATYSPRLDKRDLSFFLVGVGGQGRDPQTILTLVAHSENLATGDGRFNSGRFADPEVDRLIDAIKVEMNTVRRDELIRSAFIKLREGVYLVPLYRQMLPWAMRSNVEVVQTPWNTLVLRWVRWTDSAAER
jgi:peptide/nickel transport system substrate-binding protein